MGALASIHNCLAQEEAEADRAKAFAGIIFANVPLLYLCC